MIKLMAIDMDGTLLSPNGRVSAKNAAALRRLLTYGINAVVCTGRSPQDAFQPLQEAGLFLPVLAMNGAACYDANGRLRESAPLSEQSVQDILSKAREYGLIVDLMTEEGSITTAEEGLFRTCFEAGELLPVAETKYEEICGRFRFVSDEWVREEKPRVYKASLIAPGETKVVLNLVRASLLTNSAMNVASSADNNLELTAETVSKGQALKTYAKSCGIRMSETAAVGDSENDLSVFKLPLGLKAAMGNAADCILREADLVTADNSHNGVALLLTRLLDMDGEAADVIELYREEKRGKDLRAFLPSMPKTPSGCPIPA